MTRRVFKDRVAPGGIIALIAASIATFQIGTAFAKVDLPVPCVEDGATPLSACIKKQNSPRNLLIGPDHGAECKEVYVDGSYTTANGNALGTIQIDKGGSLFVPDQTVEIETAGIDVSGLFQAGDSMCSIGPKNKVTITFTGPRPSGPDDHTKGIVVQKGGTLRLVGNKGVPPSGVSWTHLKEAAGPAIAGATVPSKGATTIQLAKDVATGAGAWQDGDWIAVATTSFSPFETEFVQIGKPESDGKGGTKVTLKENTPLKYYHFGGPDPGEPSKANFDGDKADKDHNYGVDERAEVGLISRNIKLTSRIEPGDTNLHWGGEIRILVDFKEVTIQGVEIEKFGKEQIGSYPIHFHMAGDVSGSKPVVNANSVHHSYNKCITIHSTSNMTVQNMVCARIVGHIFYQEIGDEEGITFSNNLGLGAMSNAFDIHAPTEAKRQELIKGYWWAGDHLATLNGYDGFNISNYDAQSNPTHGSCYLVQQDGGMVFPEGNGQFTPCGAGLVYAEPASGFWIINPSATLEGNSIGGCQGVGRGYWYVPPGGESKLKFKLLGGFSNNRVHGCYAGLYAEPEFGVRSEQIFPREGGVENSPPYGRSLIAKFDKITATRNRFRSVWLRPLWFAVSDARLATSRENVTLVSSGGLDGNAPGVWALLERSVVVGLSTNNVDRFGPCPYTSDLEVPAGMQPGGQFGCIDQTAISAGQSLRGSDQIGDGYPSPRRNFFGYMIYDGPVRIFNNRFVNFNVAIRPHLTTVDQAFLDEYSKKKEVPNTPPTHDKFVYEGDAALGWFQANQSGYPTSTVSRELKFENVDLRHQIYTQLVNIDKFQDGDKNTALLDHDGTLTGFDVVDTHGNTVKGANPISLNNLPINHSSNSVDECLSEGAQNAALEERPTSLISPGSMATLEFEALWPDPAPIETKHRQVITFTKDQLEFGQHQSMDLSGRDGRGVWEPKVTSGHGYTVKAELGIPKRINVGVVDVVQPDISKDNPFYVRLGVCYTNATGTPLTADDFTITRGYKSWGGAGIFFFLDPDLNLLWNRLENRYNSQVCIDLDNANPRNLDPTNGCPAAGVTVVPTGGCPAGSTEIADLLPPVPTIPHPRPACVYPTKPLKKAASIEALDVDDYFYDAERGILFFYVAQEARNAFGPSPLGSCSNPKKTTDDPSCPDIANGESYYPCPAQGCVSYVVRLKDTVSYEPAPSACSTPYPKYQQNPPAGEFRLRDIVTKEIVKRHIPDDGGKDGKFPHHAAEVAPTCPTTKSP